MASKRQVLTRDDWLKEGLVALASEGPGGLRIDGLAKRLKVARSSYYWHFKNRDDFVEALVRFWLHELTEIVTENPDIHNTDPREQLRLTAEMIEQYDLGKYDAQFRTWAMTDPIVARGVRRVTKARMDFVRAGFERLGFKGDDLEMRTSVFVVYQSWERTTFRHLPATHRKRLRKLRLELLTSKA